MPTRHHRLFSILTLCLGLFGCDPAAPDPAPELRGGSIHETSVWSCLTDTSVTLTHDDGTVDVAADIAAGLAAYARPNDVVEVAFAATDECIAAVGSRLSLVASTQQIVSEGQGYGLFWDVHTVKLGAGPGALAVRLPDCAFRVDLVVGTPDRAMGAELDGDDDSIVWSGGAGSCEDAPVLTPWWVEVRPTKGGAEFAWQIDADPGATLVVELDVDADGQTDHVNNQCPECGEGFGELVVESCPACFDDSERRPELIVSDGVRRVWAAATVIP